MKSTLIRAALILLTLSTAGIVGCSQPDGDFESPTPASPTPNSACQEADQSPFYPDADSDAYGDSSHPVLACEAPSGYVSAGGDCDDSHATVNPSATETCDSRDNDCDTRVDEDLPTSPLYVDSDGDGFGGIAIVTCASGLGYSTNDLDCDDKDASAFPGAPDAEGDGVDSSCDNRDGLAPSVGLTTSAYTSIQSALDAGEEGDILWIGPGTYLEAGLSMNGKGLSLVSTAGSEKTVVDAQSQGSVMIFEGSEVETSVVRGFTLTGGMAENGGGLQCIGGSPLLEDLVLRENTAYDSGGGFLLSGGAPTLRNVVVESNNASRFGGGGMMKDGTEAVLEDGVFRKNGEPDVGGGVFLEYSNSLLTNVLFIGNSASGFGGGVSLRGSNPVLRNLTVIGNTADYGGGMFLEVSNPLMTHLTVAGNSSNEVGGGMYLTESSPTLTNSILASNIGLNLVYVYMSQPALSYVNLYSPYGASHNLTSLPPTVLEVNPEFIAFSDDDNPSNDDLHLQPDSPLIDAGDPTHCSSTDPSGCDPDGSLPDLGAYGGATADRTYYTDSDKDGLYDGWEHAKAGDLVTLEGTLDADEDGLPDLGELSSGTNPQQADCDGDGFVDGAEVSAQRDPLNPYSIPGVEGLVALEVPSSQYPTIQSAIDAISTGGYIRIKAGTYPENLMVTHKRVVMEGAGEGQTVLDGQQLGSVVTVDTATLELSGVTIQNGTAEFGGGLNARFAAGSLTHVTVSDNSAGRGGGVYLHYSSPAMSQVTVARNSASDGGGIAMESSSPFMTEVVLTSNWAIVTGGGGYLAGSSPILTQITVTQNSSGYGGGMYLEHSSAILSQVTLSGNSADNQGGALFLGGGSPDLSRLTLTGNSATWGAGIYMFLSDPVMSNAAITGNSAGEGGGMYQVYSSPILTNITLAGNSADIGGGVYLKESSPTFLNTIMAVNSRLDLYQDDLSHPVLEYTNLFSPFGTSHDLKDIPPTVLELDPEFVSISQDGTSSNDDVHLRPDSPLVDAGDPTHCSSTNRSGCDPDGTLPDLGAYGGENADFSYYADSDGDGLYDGWELTETSGLSTLAGVQDADADGLTDGEELSAGTDPQQLDCDGDGFSDGEEVSASNDPLNPYSQPGVEGLVALEVPSSQYPTIQSAIDVISTEGYIRIKPGTYPENLIVAFKRVVMEGAGEGLTVLDGQQLGSVLTVDGAGIDLSGVTIRNGTSQTSGSGVYARYASGSLTNVTLTNNSAHSGEGGGIYLVYSNPALANLILTSNLAYYSGGGIGLYHSSPIVTNVTLVNNTARYGGGMSIISSNPTLSNITFTGNSAERGGGLSIEASDPTLAHVILTDNTAEFGGGIYCYDSSPTLTHITAVTNSAGTGAGIYVERSSPTILNSILAYNIGLNLYVNRSSQPVLTYTDLYSRFGASHNLLSLPPTVVEVNPGFVTCSEDGNPLNDDLHLHPGSALIDAGDPAHCSSMDATGCDPDGSLPDLGAHGGAGADFSYYTDSDGDGYFDGWEQAQVGDLVTLDGNQDADGDALTDSEELYAGTAKQKADTDSDGYSDGVEVSASKDPLNLFSVPGVEGLVPLDVPSSQYSTIQSAINAISTEGYIRVKAGTYTENLKIKSKHIILEGVGADQTVLDGLQKGSVVTAEGATVELMDLTLMNGKATSGGGLAAKLSVGSLMGVTVAENSADYGGGVSLSSSYPMFTETRIIGNSAGLGGGMHLDDSSPVLARVNIVDNSAGLGGGMYLKNSHPALTHVTLSGNSVTLVGGGMYLEYSAPTLTQVSLTHNSAEQSGGGMYLGIDSNPTLTHVTLSGNSAALDGGGMYLYYSAPTLTQVSLTHNSAEQSGGGIYLHDDSNPTLKHVTLSGNTATANGGGMYLEYSAPTLTQVSLTHNSAEQSGGGMYLGYDSSPVLTQTIITGNFALLYGGGLYLDYASLTLDNSVLAYNESPYYGGNIWDSSGFIAVSNSNLYNPDGFSTDNLTPTGTYTTVEPQFLTYADSETGAPCLPGSSLTCLPDDLHLALTSPLVNAGDPESFDADGSRSDIGIYGGPDGDAWDVDGDGVPDYFWPGEWSDAPLGFDKAAYDCDDLDDAVLACE